MTFSFFCRQKYNFEIDVSIIPYLETAKLVISVHWVCYGVELASLYLIYSTVLTCSLW